MQPLVNIMMPVYNGLPIIKASIQSILVQTYPNWHCIICDDGSTDGTYSYLLKTLSTDPRFTILHNEVNLGRGISRQRILNQCRGIYVCMLDADDLMHPDRLTILTHYLDTHPEVGMVSSGMISFGLHTDLLTVRGLGNNLINRYNGNVSVCFPASMFRTAIAKSEDVSFGTLNSSEDIYFLIRYYSHNPLYYQVPEPLYYYNEFGNHNSWAEILCSYIRLMRLSLHPLNLKQVFLNLLKLFYTLVTCPFASLDKRVAKRGRAATVEERQDFNKYTHNILRQL